MTVPATEPAQAGSPAPAHTGRRDFFTWVARGSLVVISALAVGEGARFFSYESTGETPTMIPVGKPADYAGGTLTYVPSARAYIGRDGNGLYALDAVCTHLGCLVQQQAGGGFACPCHGSRFTADGQVITGPADRALPYLGLQLNQDGQVVVDRARQVIPATRLAVPT
jgi:cytochrome b6-f complex iron-sulfur subunit